MSKINIQGTIDNIRSKSNVYTPLVEAVVNAIDSIKIGNIQNGQITIIVKREQTIFEDNSLANIESIEIHDNGIGFTQENRDSFDTLYSLLKKKDLGGKGFGRFMYLKYFSDVRIESHYKGLDEIFYHRKFTFGKKDEIIVNESNEPSNLTNNSTTLYLNNLQQDKSLDKELETIARKLLEKLLIFFINEDFGCPEIILKEFDNSNQINLNRYLKGDHGIRLLATKDFELKSSDGEKKESFIVKIFKIYFSKIESKIILTADNREVTESSLHNYVPEFEDEFYDEIDNGKRITRKNYVIKTYVLGDYLNSSVSLERESFNFDKDKVDLMYNFSQLDVERAAAMTTKEAFISDVKLRAEKKQKRIYDYINTEAPWHKSYIADVDLTLFAYNSSPEKIEMELQKYKFHKEQETKKDIQSLINATEDSEFDTRINDVMNNVTEMGKSDLAHYVCTRKIVLQVFEELRKRNEDGKANLEKDIHSLIYPMNRDSTNTDYEQHNLWLLDERLVFSEYIASDRKISKQLGALDEPDLLIFDIKKSYRNGDNEFSNPLTIFEFKRPKRNHYTQDDDPVLQIGRYLDKIRQGKYEMPEGVEVIKVNDSTPIYAYVVCDIVDKIHDFARQHQLTVSADQEGYFGFHSGYKMYIEIISFKKLLKDAILRNKIFFKKLQME
ncbi:MAG: ATP-binding protein [Sphingobacteriales bacterium]